MLYSRRRPILPAAVLGALLVLIALFDTSCKGIGLGESGMPDLKPPPPPDLSAAVYHGELSGRIVFDEGFLHHEFLSQGGAVPGAGRVASGLSRDRGFYRTLKVRAHGKKGKYAAQVGEDGSFSFGSVRNGTYTLTVVGTRGPLLSSTLTIDGRSRTRVTLRVMGQDLADIDHDKNTQELVIQQEIDYESDRIRYTRIRPPVGEIQTLLPDGSREVLGTDGYVKAILASGEILYRYDPKNEFTDLRREAEVGNKKKDPAVRRRSGSTLEELTGPRRVPLVTTSRLRSLAGGETGDHLDPGDLAILEVQVDENGGPPVKEVRIRARSASGELRDLVAVDDGSSKDLKDAWAGSQASLDREAGDGIFTVPIPLDGGSYAFYRSSHLLLRAGNQSGQQSQPRSHHIYLARSDRDLAGASRLPQRVKVARLAGARADGTLLHRARVAIEGRPSPGLSAVLLGPGSYKKLLFPEPAEEGAPGFWLGSIPQALPEPGLYTVLVSDRSGDVFYACFRPAPPRRAD